MHHPDENVSRTISKLSRLRSIPEGPGQPEHYIRAISNQNQDHQQNENHRQGFPDYLVQGRARNPGNYEQQHPERRSGKPDHVVEHDHYSKMDQVYPRLFHEGEDHRDEHQSDG